MLAETMRVEKRRTLVCLQEIELVSKEQNQRRVTIMEAFSKVLVEIRARDLHEAMLQVVAEAGKTIPRALALQGIAPLGEALRMIR